MTFIAIDLATHSWPAARACYPCVEVEAESSSPELLPCPPAPFARLLFTLDEVFFIFALSVGLYLRSIASEDKQQ